MSCFCSFWRRRWDSNPRAVAGKLISSQPRYDHFDTSPCINLLIYCPKRDFESAPLCPVAVPEILCSLFASQNFDRCHSLSSLFLPLAALASLPTSIRLQIISVSAQMSPCRLIIAVSFWKIKENPRWLIRHWSLSARLSLPPGRLPAVRQKTAPAAACCRWFLPPPAGNRGSYAG